jgi:hypothetical protein
MRVLRILAGLLVSIAEFLMVIALALSWMEAHLGRGFYFAEAIDARIFYLVTGMAGFALAAYAVVRRQAAALALALAGSILLLLACSIPSTLTSWPAAAGSVRNKALGLQDAPLTWGTNHGHLPANEKELTEAVGPAFQEWRSPSSPYAQRGKRVAYRVVYEGNAAGPYLGELASPKPAQIFCAISPDLKQAWLTATALERDVDEQAVFLPNRESGRPWTVQVTLPAAPQPAKKP